MIVYYMMGLSKLEFKIPPYGSKYITTTNQTISY